MEKKSIFILKKIIISCLNYRTLQVKEPDVASPGETPETPGGVVPQN